MNRFQVLRIAALLALIFAAGVVTGRLTAPRSPVLVPAVGGRVATTSSVLVLLTRQVGLDAKQQEKFQPLLEEMMEQMAQFPPASEERREIFRRYLPRMRELIQPEQHAAFDRYARLTESRLERLIRQREGR